MKNILACPNPNCKSRCSPHIARWVSGYDPKMQTCRVHCDCGCSGPEFDSEDSAIDGWNNLPRNYETKWIKISDADHTAWPPNDKKFLIKNGNAYGIGETTGPISITIMYETGVSHIIFLNQPTLDLYWARL